MLLVANETIEIIPLPQGSQSFYELIDFARGKTLPTLNQFLQRPCRVLNEEGVHMVRHDYRRNHNHSLAFKMAQSLLYDFRALALAQKTRAVPGIGQRSIAPEKRS